MVRFKGLRNILGLAFELQLRELYYKTESNEKVLLPSLGLVLLSSSFIFNLGIWTVTVTMMTAIMTDNSNT